MVRACGGAGRGQGSAYLASGQDAEFTASETLASPLLLLLLLELIYSALTKLSDGNLN